MPNPNSPKFPALLPTDLDLGVASNKALTTLNVSINSNVTSFAALDASGFSVPCFIQIDNEIILAGNKSGNTFTSCVRGYSNTTATSHTSGAFIKGFIVAHLHNQLAAEVKAICSALGTNLDNVVEVTDNAGGEISGNFANLSLVPNGIVAGTYGAEDKTPNITVDNAGRVEAIQLLDAAGSGIRVMPIFYKAAIAQGTNAVLGFSFGLANAPAATLVTGANQTWAVATFTQAQNYSVQDHFSIPADWTGDIDVEIIWRTSVTAGSATWQLQFAGFRPNEATDKSWGPMNSITTAAVSPALNLISSTSTTLNLSGIQAGDEVYFKFARSASDSIAADVELIGLRFFVKRFWNNGVTLT